MPMHSNVVGCTFWRSVKFYHLRMHGLVLKYTVAHKITRFCFTLMYRIILTMIYS